MSQSNKVLVVGSGAREHALVWKLHQSPLIEKLYCSPGNAGTAELAENLPYAATDVKGICEFCVSHQIDMVVIGPEAALEAGLADCLDDKGIRVFGPHKLAAEIETSKAFSKAFMQRHKIPTPAFTVFSDFEAARDYWRQHSDRPLVIKASGLAAGKGVFLPETQVEGEQILKGLLEENQLGSAGAEVVIEERLFGDELSVMAFSDGRTVTLMPAAQDHKRLNDNDRGPNTGGMGAYAPAPIGTPEVLEKVRRHVLEPAVAGLRAEGRPFVGVLYAGIILTHQGIKVLEFNTRFGDPETQVVLPLLESDLYEVCNACVDGMLDRYEVKWTDQYCVCVVAASAGYPEHVQKGKLIRMPEYSDKNVVIFHGGTALHEGKLVTSGGRVFGVTAFDTHLDDAVVAAYQTLETPLFDGMHFRNDIASKALDFLKKRAYETAGVNIDAGNRAVRLMKESVASTADARVLSSLGSFGGLYDVTWLKDYQQPVLVASTDGVGTKVKLAARAGRYSSLGEDIVNHCINDILVQGAKPLFFLDYFATARLEPEIVAEIVSGMAKACRESHCAILGGETAEMPGVYQEKEFDIAGTIVGVVERSNIIPRDDIEPGDVLLGIASNGLHTNGYSLARRLFESVDLMRERLSNGVLVIDALLAPHKSYLPTLLPLIENPEKPVKALVHITGGGFIENIPRVLPEGSGVEIDSNAWQVPEIFKVMERIGRLDQMEMMRVFNMGIGMVLVCSPENAAAIMKRFAEPVYQIGRVIASPNKEVIIR